MATDPTRINYLIEQFSQDAISRAEFDELCAILKEDEEEAAVKANLMQVVRSSSLRELSQEKMDRMLQNILREERRPGRLRFMTPLRWIAAASIIVFIAIGIVLSMQTGGEQDTQIVQTTNDVEAPKETRAVITLANGDKIYLDSAGTGTLVKQDGIEVIRNNEGEIVYEGSLTSDVSRLTYNTLSNPRGSKVISLTLSDGTKVWLNSESSLKYPTAFTGNTREVEITGEAYFEVAKARGTSPFNKGGARRAGDSRAPFFVKANGVTTEVLGTHFNVNSYTDEDGVKVTLLEGSVKVSSGSESAIIKPGQQAVAVSSPAGGGREGALQTTNYIDLDEVMAWKNGRFQFGDKVDIETIMRQIARWYDVDVEFKEKITQHFGGSISREVNISQVLKIMEATGGVKFKVEGKKVIVMK